MAESTPSTKGLISITAQYKEILNRNLLTGENEISEHKRWDKDRRSYLTSHNSSKNCMYLFIMLMYGWEFISLSHMRTKQKVYT